MPTPIHRFARARSNALACCFTALALGFAVLLGGGAGLTLPAQAADADQARRELAEVRKRIKALKQQVDHGQDRRDELSRALAQVEQEIGALAKRMHQLRESIRKRREAIAELDGKREKIVAGLGRRLDNLSGQLRAVYKNGQQSKLRLLLSQDDPTRLGRMLAYYDYFAEAQIKGIEQLRAQAAELLETRELLAQERAALEADEKRQASTLAVLRDTEKQREAALREADRKLAASGRSLAGLQQNEAELRGLIERLRKELAKVDTTVRTQPLGNYKGRLTPPVEGNPIARFGQTKPGGKLRWQGHWLAAETGAPVRAAAAGRVVYVGWMHRYGLIAVLDHGGDFFTLYGHSQSVYPDIGAWVKAGEVIAAAGNSGGHRKTGVYFEIRQGKKPLDPSAWLPRG